MSDSLFSYISASPTAFHAVAHTAECLKQQGFEALCESEEWQLSPGKSYFVTRNGSSLLAFRLPVGDFSGLMMVAAHSDSPCFKIKENAEQADAFYVRLSTEKYGGMLCSSWMDRPLSIAGRVLVRTENGMASHLVDFRTPQVIIPNVAIHMNRSANDGTAFNPAVDMLPLYGCETEKGAFRRKLAEKLGVSEADILATDLFVYNPQECAAFHDLITAPRLDDLQCAYTALQAFCKAKTVANLPMYCLFDNEEVGSATKQGANSTFLTDTVARIAEALGFSENRFRCKLANSFLVSADNAHAMHPNHREFVDPNHTVYLNRGVVIKYNAAQKYTSDGVSAAFFRTVCEKAGVPFQFYANRADLPGGSTLGNIADTRLSVNSVDIGLAQLAMHSAYETAGALDTDYMIRALTQFYESTLQTDAAGHFCLK